jgi:hypothetical protein
MNSNLRRLEALEERLRPPVLALESDDARRWCAGLSESVWMKVVEQFAGLFAHMRYRQDVGFPAGARQGHCDDWRDVVPAEERTELMLAEVARLDDLFLIDRETALATWADTAVREGWPALRGPTYTIDQAGFEDLLRRLLLSMDQARAADHPFTALWRRVHPDWRPGMTHDAALAFDFELLARESAAIGRGRLG